MGPARKRSPSRFRPWFNGTRNFPAETAAADAPPPRRENGANILIRNEGRAPSRRASGGVRLAGFLLACLPAIIASGCDGSLRVPVARSVMLITIDTWRAGFLGAGGDPGIRTPALDRFFRSAVQFSRTFSPVPTTLASHTSLLSGAWPTRHGVPANLWKVPDDVTTVAEILTAHGFDTAAFVSSAALDPEFNLDQGFSTYNFKPVQLEQHESPWRPAARTLQRCLTYWNDTPSPRFLWAHLWEPHFPYEPPPILARLYDPDYRGTANGSMKYLMKAWGATEPLPDRDRQHVIQLYRAEITELDRTLGQFLDRVDLDDAVVVVTSDHGESLGEHGLEFKHGPQVFSADVRVPLALKAPGLESGVSNAMVRTIDVPRTILRLAGVDDSALPEEAGNLLDWTHGGAGLPAFAVATQPWAMRAEGTYPNMNLQRIVRVPEAAYAETPYLKEVAWFDRTDDPGEVESLPFPDTALADSLRSSLDDWIDEARYRPGYAPVGSEPLREQLKALGYIE